MSAFDKVRQFFTGVARHRYLLLGAIAGRFAALGIMGDKLSWLYFFICLLLLGGLLQVDRIVEEIIEKQRQMIQLLTDQGNSITLIEAMRHLNRVSRN